uniref:Uncharacterized protein n=1 Tax=Peronospora matthiolae TaxID=2874970 RepID=A0AAV1TMR4_9STRA
MTESKPPSNTLEEFYDEGMVDYESDTAASSIYDNPSVTPPPRDTTRVAPS